MKGAKRMKQQCPHCRQYKADAEHFEAEHRKLWIEATDLAQRNKLLQEMVALQRQTISELQGKVAQSVRAEEITKEEYLRKSA